MFAAVELKATPQFLEDARRLAGPEARKLAATIQLLREQGVTYGSLKTRPIERNRLEFKRLYLPGLNDSYPFGDRDDPDEMIEKGSLLYVAMSRARDDLDLSYAGRPSMFLDALIPFVDVMEHSVPPLAVAAPRSVS